MGFNAIPKAHGRSHRRADVRRPARFQHGPDRLHDQLLPHRRLPVSIGLSTLEPPPPRKYRDILRSLGASNVTIFWKIPLPKTLPSSFGALKVAVTLAFIGTNLMEIVSPQWPGSLATCSIRAASNADYPLMFAVLFALAALGILLFYFVVFLERIFRRLGRTQPGVRGTPLRPGVLFSYVTVERLARAGASPTRSGPEGSSRNEPRLGRCPASHPKFFAPPVSGANKGHT